MPLSYVPIVSTAHLVVRWLIGITCQACTSGTTRTYPKSEGSSMISSTRVALRDPRGVSTIPLTNPPPEHRTIFSCASTESQATKPSRRWQPLRVTSTTVLKHEHLVPLDAISQCNALESLTSLLICTLASTSELKGFQAHLHKPPRLKGAQLTAKG